MKLSGSALSSAAHWASYLVHQGQIDAHSSVQIGMRGNPRTLDWLEPSLELGYEVISIDRYRELFENGRLTDNVQQETWGLDGQAINYFRQGDFETAEQLLASAASNW